MLMSMDRGVTPTDNDVLAGRGKTWHNHPGNQRFRALIALYIPKYADDNTTRKQKTQFVQTIVEEMLGEGHRFLKMDSKTKQWHELDKHKAKCKVGHALRDATAEMLRSLQASTGTNLHDGGRKSKKVKQVTSNSGKITASPLQVTSSSSSAPSGEPAGLARGMEQLATRRRSLSKGEALDESSSSSSDDDEGLFPKAGSLSLFDVEPTSIAALTLGTVTQQANTTAIAHHQPGASSFPFLQSAPAPVTSGGHEFDAEQFLSLARMLDDDQKTGNSGNTTGSSIGTRKPS